MIKILQENSKNFLINEVADYLNLNDFNSSAFTLRDGVKRLCIEKLRVVLGIRCRCNDKSIFFDYYSSIVGEAVCQTLKLPIIIAEEKFRFFKYEHVNLVDHSIDLLKTLEIDDAFLEIFKFLDQFKYVVDCE